MLDHLDDLDADFRVFYGVHGIGEEQFGDLTGPRFFALAVRTGAYSGVMAARVAEELDEGDRPAAARSAGGRGDLKEVPGERAALMANADLASVIDFG